MFITASAAASTVISPRTARSISAATIGPLAFNELHGDRPRYDPRANSPLQKPSYSLTPLVAVIQRPVVHVHPNELVGFAAIQAARVLHRVVQGILAMVEAIRDALPQLLRYL